MPKSKAELIHIRETLSDRQSNIVDDLDRLDNRSRPGSVVTEEQIAALVDDPDATIEFPAVADIAQQRAKLQAELHGVGKSITAVSAQIDEIEAEDFRRDLDNVRKVDAPALYREAIAGLRKVAKVIRDIEALNERMSNHGRGGWAGRVGIPTIHQWQHYNERDPYSNVNSIARDAVELGHIRADDAILNGLSWRLT